MDNLENALYILTCNGTHSGNLARPKLSCESPLLSPSDTASGSVESNLGSLDGCVMGRFCPTSVVDFIFLNVAF